MTTNNASGTRRNGTSSRTGKAAAELAARRAEALTKRRQGLRPALIAQQMGVHPSTVHQWIADAIKEVVREPAEDVLHLELERLDDMQAVVTAKALKGDLRAVEANLRIMERRARYLALDTQPSTGLEVVGSLLDRLVNGAPE